MGKAPNRVISWCYNSNTARQHRDIAYFGVDPDFANLGEYKNPTDKRIAKRIAEGKKARGYDWMYCDQVKNTSKEKMNHPCQMPLKVMSYIISTLPKNSTIIDPFAGTGTTLVASKNQGIEHYFGIEISPDYCEIIKERIQGE